MRAGDGVVDEDQEVGLRMFAVSLHSSNNGLPSSVSCWSFLILPKIPESRARLPAAVLGIPHLASVTSHLLHSWPLMSDDDGH